MTASAIQSMNSPSLVVEARFRFRLSATTEILSADERAGYLLGFDANEFLASRVSLVDRIHRDDCDYASLLFSPAQVRRSGSLNLRIRHGDGKFRCFRAVFERTRRGGEDLLDLALADAKSLSQRIDEQPRSALFRAMMENTSDIIFFKDRHHVFTAASRSLLDTLALSLGGADLVGLTDYDFLPESEADAFFRPEKEVLAGADCSHHLQRIEMPDGRVRWMDDRRYPVKSEDGEIVGMFAIARDITERVQAENALRGSESALKESQRIAGIGSYVFDMRVEEWSSSEVLDSLFGIERRARHAAEEWVALIHPDERGAIAAYFKNCLEEGKAFNKEYRIVRPTDQSVRWLHGLGKVEFDAHGIAAAMHGTIQDITDRKLAEERLKLMANVFTHASEAILITDLDGSILEVNDAFVGVTGFPREEVLGRNPRILQSGLQGKAFYEDLWRSIRQAGQWRGELWNRRKGGELFAAASTISTVCDAAGKPQNYVAVFSDITPMKEQERKLAHLARYDALTGLPNRTLLAEDLWQAMESLKPGRMLAVAYFDLDRFKAVNDRYGRETGDSLLTAVAVRMKHVLRSGDLVARIGGDEFVAVLKDLDDADSATPILAALHCAADDPLQIADQVLQVSASAGVVFYPQAEEVDADQLLRQANHAMYEAKLAGKNRYRIFDVTQDQSIRTHHDDIEHVRRALAARDFLLYYQPKVNMAKGTVVGAEALLRWQHPQWGLLSPGLFLPIIENHSLTVDLGEWVIETALAQIERWSRTGLDLPVSVNVSGRHLQDPDFISRLRALLAAHPAVPPSMLELEVLETSALRDVAQVSQLIAECRRLGVSVALDDFGTGYSSLTYLKRLPANVLKIDQSFVREMLNDPEDLAILEGVMGLAVAFQRQAVAEGVETVEQGAMLLQLGCELAQGFGIARPMPGEDMPWWAAKWRPDPCWSCVSPVSPGDLPLLYAGVEHRAWTRLVSSFLKGERETSPELGENQCRMGAWLLAERPGARGAAEGFQQIDALHRRLHAVADETMELKASGRPEEGVALLGELDNLLDEMAKRLQAFMKKC